MISNIVKREGTHNMIWWSWEEVCDRCGEHTENEPYEHSCAPDETKPQFCLKCLRYFLDNDIPWDAVKHEYQK